jgi:hypothetical protein
MRSQALRRIIRYVLREEIGRNFHTVNTDPISYKDFANYEVDIIVTSDGKYTSTIFFKDKKITPTRSYNTREEAELAARHVVDRHRFSQEN